MAIAYVTGTTGADNTTSATSLQITFAVSAGDCIVVCVGRSGANDVTGVSDDGNNTYTERAAYPGAVGQVSSHIFTAIATASATAITISFPSGSKTTAAIGKYSGVGGVGNTNTNNGTGTVAILSVTLASSSNWQVSSLVVTGKVTVSQGAGNLRGSQTNNSGGVTTGLSDNTGSTTPSCSMTWSGSYAWAAAGCELTGSSTTPQSCGGTLALSGVLPRKPKKPLAGSFVAAGSETRKAKKALAAALNVIGTLTKKATRLFVAAFTPVGALARKTARGISGQFTVSGSLGRKAKKALSGALATSGALARKIKRALAGALSLSAILNAVKNPAGGETFYKTVTAVLNFVGGHTGGLSKIVTGSLVLSGTLHRKISHRLAASSLAFTGTVTKGLKSLLTGTLAMAGSLTRKSYKSFAASLALIGSLGVVQLLLQAISGTLDFAGGLVRKAKKGISGTLVFAGTFGKTAKKALTAALTFLGTLTPFKKVLVLLEATLVVAGSLGRKTKKQCLASLALIGRVTKRSAWRVAGVLGLVGTSNEEWHGPPPPGPLYAFILETAQFLGIVKHEE